MSDFSNDILYSLFQEAPDWLSGLLSLITQSAAITFLLSAVTIVLVYLFPCYVRMHIGRKAGLQGDWMAYFPIAMDVYCLRMVNAPLWYLCFFGGTGILCLLAVVFLFSLMLLSAGTFGLTVLLILAVGFLVMRIYVHYQFFSKYYAAFGFNPRLAIMTFVPGYEIAQTVTDVWIAFSDAIQFGSEPYPTSSPTPTPTPSPAPFRNDDGRITGLEGMYKGGTFPIGSGEEILLGRENRDCQIIFDKMSPEVSSRHCTIRYQASTGQYIVTDYSKNGTFMSDGTRLPAQSPMPLSAGTIIYLGSRKNTFKLG
ncbi:MAG: FHA domain-containing protein [Clostridia bacterium]|nr:FHA domain-containing protein [Clostridia bacterium]